MINGAGMVGLAEMPRKITDPNWIESLDEKEIFQTDSKRSGSPRFFF